MLKAQIAFQQSTIDRHEDELKEGREVFAEIRDHLGVIREQGARANEREKTVDEKLRLLASVDKRVATIEQKLPGLIEARRWIVTGVLGIIGLVGLAVWELVIKR